MHSPPGLHFHSPIPSTRHSRGHGGLIFLYRRIPHKISTAWPNGTTRALTNILEGAQLLKRRLAMNKFVEVLRLGWTASWQLQRRKRYRDGHPRTCEPVLGRPRLAPCRNHAARDTFLSWMSHRPPFTCVYQVQQRLRGSNGGQDEAGDVSLLPWVFMVERQHASSACTRGAGLEAGTSRPEQQQADQALGSAEVP